MSLPAEFYVTLASDESLEYFHSENKEPIFTNKLAIPLLFKEPYHVAITEIYIPSFEKITKSINNDENNTIYKVRKKRNVLNKDLNIKLTSEEDNFEINISRDIFIDKNKRWNLYELLKIFLDNFVIDTHLDIAKAILKNIIKNVNVMELPDFKRTVPDTEEYFWIRIPYDKDKLNKYKYATVGVPIKSYSSLKTFFEQIISTIYTRYRSENMMNLIFEDMNDRINTSTNLNAYEKMITDILLEERNLNTNNSANQMNIDQDDIAQIVGSTSKTRAITIKNHVNDDDDDDDYDENGKIVSAIPYMSKDLRMIFIFSDIISPHMYANKMLTTLRIIPHFEKSDFRNGLHLYFDSPEFYPLSRDWIESISIVITMREYDLSFLQNNINPIYLKLLFKRIQNE